MCTSASMFSVAVGLGLGISGFKSLIRERPHRSAVSQSLTLSLTSWDWNEVRNGEYNHVCHPELLGRRQDKNVMVIDI